MRRFNRSILTLAVAAPLLQLSPFPSAFAGTLSADAGGKLPAVTAQPDVGADLARYFNDPRKDPGLSQKELVKLLRKKIKYVFVIFNENHSFDNEFGTFPGVNGLYSDGVKPRPAGQTPGFTQTYMDAGGMKVTVRPFRIGPELLRRHGASCSFRWPISSAIQASCGSSFLHRSGPASGWFARPEWACSPRCGP